MAPESEFGPTIWSYDVLHVLGHPVIHLSPSKSTITMTITVTITVTITITTTITITLAIISTIFTFFEQSYSLHADLRGGRATGVSAARSVK